MVAVVLPKRQAAPTIASLTNPEQLTLEGLVDEAILAVTADLGAVALDDSITIVAAIDRATLLDAALAVYRASPDA